MSPSDSTSLLMRLRHNRAMMRPDQCRGPRAPPYANDFLQLALCGARGKGHGFVTFVLCSI